MNILVDGRAFVKTSAGISTFLQGSLRAWAELCPNDTFYLALPKERDKTLQNWNAPKNVVWIISNNCFFNKLPNLIWLSLMMPIYCLKYSVDVYYTPVPCIPFFMRKHTKKLIVVHDVVNLEYNDTMQWSNRIANFLFFKRSIKKADFIWTNSHYTKERVDYYFPRRKCCDIFVGCSVNRECYRKQIISNDILNETKKKFAIKSKFLLFVGSLEPRKNLSFLLSVMPEIWRRTKLQLVVVGAKGWKNSGVFNVVNEVGYPKECVIFCGYVSNEELSVLYNIAECFVSPSLNEGFGMPQLEAFLCGCPVITADNSAMTEVAKDKKGSCLIKGYDKNDWIDKITFFVSEHETVDVNEFNNYDWNVILKSFLESNLFRDEKHN